eukprot:EG_transcript_18644
MPEGTDTDCEVSGVQLADPGPSLPVASTTTRGPAVVYVVRHGERLDRADPAWRAAARRPHDPPLTARGVEQALALGRHLQGSGVRCIYCSPLIRAVQTADAIAEGLGLSGPCLRVDHCLLEYDGPLRKDLRNACPLRGQPMLLSAADLRAYSSRIDEAYRSTTEVVLSDLGREIGSLTSAQRCQSGFLRLMADSTVQGAAIVAVGHGASVMGCLKALGVHPSAPLAPYTGWSKVCREDGQWVAQGYLNCRDHLAAGAAVKGSQRATSHP